MQPAGYMIYNSAQATTAAPVKQSVSTVKTMMQLRTATGIMAYLKAWGCSFDGSAAATPGQVEFFETTVAATMTSAYATADIMKYNPASPTPTSGASGVPLNLSTTTSGFASGSVTEGTVANYRGHDLQMVAPTGQYAWQWTLGDEPMFVEQLYQRVRMTFGSSVNAYIWVLFYI